MKLWHVKVIKRDTGEELHQSLCRTEEGAKRSHDKYRELWHPDFADVTTTPMMAFPITEVKPR